MFSYFFFRKNWFFWPKWSWPSGPLWIPHWQQEHEEPEVKGRISELQWRVWPPQSELVQIKQNLSSRSPMPRYRELQKSRRLAISAEGQGRARHGTAGRAGRAEQGRAGHSGQGRAGHSGRAGQGRAGQGRAGQGRAGQGRAGQGEAGQGRTGQGRAG